MQARPARALSARQANLVTLALLGAILLLGAWLRIAGHNWDQDQHLNADDYYVARVTLKKVSWPPNPTLAQLVDPAHSPLNPRTEGEFYVYGSLPLYLVKATSSALAGLTGDRYFAGLNGILQTGRVMSALADTLTALLVFLIGWLVWGRKQGLLAAAFYALAMLPIQMGHFYLVDVFMTTLMTATLLLSITYIRSGRLWAIAGAGATSGLAMACKLSAAPVLAVPLLAVLFAAIAARHESAWWRRMLVPAALVLLAALAGLFVGDPFAIADAGTYAGVLGQQAAIQNGAIDQWFSRKYVGTWPVLHFLGQLALIGIGPLVGVAGAAGAVAVAWRAWRERSLTQALVLGGALVYFASIAFVELKWVRYLLPLVPYLALFAAVFAVWLLTSAQSCAPLWLRAAPASILLASALVGAFALSTIFRTEHTQIEASRWLLDHAPAGSSIGYEYTAIEMPLPLPGYPNPEKAYKLVRMDPLDDRPSQAASDALYAQLSQSDYLILDSTQAMSTVPRLPWRYPVQIRYYDLLKTGQLGFHLALKATSYPRVLGLTFRDDLGWVDLSFMDSSHPPIYVFKKDRMPAKAEWDALFAQAVAQPSVPSRWPPK